MAFPSLLGPGGRKQKTGQVGYSPILSPPKLELTTSEDDT